MSKAVITGTADVEKIFGLHQLAKRRRKPVSTLLNEALGQYLEESAKEQGDELPSWPKDERDDGVDDEP